MQLHNTRVALTGAAGGIGRLLAREMGLRGARLGLVDVRPEPLQALAAELTEQGIRCVPVVADITAPEGREAIAAAMHTHYAGCDLLVNNAGVMDYTEFADQDPAQLERLLRINLLAPLALTRRLLPDMIARGRGQIVNVGSMFGSIAFACFAAYSASKFGLRGFSEALRRELEGTGVRVTYVSPRAVRTPLNSAAVQRMAARVNMAMDEPAAVAQGIVRAIERDAKDVYLGRAESWFVRINALLPRLVDLALRRQNRVMRACTKEV